MGRSLIIATGCMFLALLVLPAESFVLIGPTTYNCQSTNPCTGANPAQFHPHDNQTKFVQCSATSCYEMSCPAGLIWYQNLLRCDWVGINPPPSDTSACNCTVSNPCNYGTAGYFSCSSDSTKFGQCDQSGGCTIQSCPPGPPQQVWDGNYKTCKLSTSGNNGQH